MDAPGGNAADPQHGGTVWSKPVYFPSSPMKSIQVMQTPPKAKLTYNDGTEPLAAAAAAKSADIAIVFVNQFTEARDHDSATSSLPDHQDALVSAVAAANPNTIVVLETGGPVTMPWHDNVKGILAAWYPGIGGAQAMANLIFGDVNPSGKLPLTFAKSDADLPHPQVTGLTPRSRGTQR